MTGWSPESNDDHARIRFQIEGNLHVLNAHDRALVEHAFAYPDQHEIEVLDRLLERPGTTHGTEIGLRIDKLVLWIPTGWMALPPESVN